ncbi:MAG TPA: flagellar hook-basal body complex protein FliE [Desulfobacterales bacterium]|nr:flagellar hook-basal body complex protein FliE [Desulfobacterales bacterium]
MNGLSINDRISTDAIFSKNRSETKSKGFLENLKCAVSEVNRLQNEADNAIEKVEKGTMGIHEGMLSITKADISLRFMLQVRNKMIDAYKEIKNMQF